MMRKKEVLMKEIGLELQAELVKLWFPHSVHIPTEKVIFSVAANREVQLTRTICHAAGLAVQIYIFSFEKPTQRLLITCGVISGFLSIPATENAAGPLRLNYGVIV